MKPETNSVRFIYSRVIMAIQWIVRCSMLLYLGGTVIPVKVIMGIQWMVGWTGGCLCPLPHLLYPLWIDWPRHLFRELHN